MRRPPIFLCFLLVVSLVLLPADSNIAANALPPSWQPYLWLAWPIGALLAIPLIVWEIRKSRAPGTDERPAEADASIVVPRQRPCDMDGTACRWIVLPDGDQRIAVPLCQLGVPCSGPPHP